VFLDGHQFLTLVFSLLTRVSGNCDSEKLGEHVSLMLETRTAAVVLLHALLMAAVCSWALESPFYELTRVSDSLFDQYRTLLK
jgi:hypothetical protein